MPYDLIDKIIENKKAEKEAKRQQTLFKLMEVLSTLALKYGFSKVYIFGSVTKKGRFRDESDVDIAVFDLKDENFFQLMGEVSNLIGREVDLYQMEKINGFLKKRIEETGLLWTRED
ncbi:TPA: nucleotidyltransferase domain-containing protein [Candidatus Poribacteria bacterium]|nr:nucleotidyltransferase domain-containing protein [Candidatus Poribacteria bacterium]